MSDLEDRIFSKVSANTDLFSQIMSKVPGFNGYMERQNRREADKLLREMIADRFEELWQRVSSLQRQFISQGEIGYVDDLEAAAIKLRTFADRVRRATYGYSGLFDEGADQSGGDYRAVPVRCRAAGSGGRNRPGSG